MKNIFYIILFILCNGVFSALDAQIIKTLTEGEVNIEIGIGYNKFYGYEDFGPYAVPNGESFSNNDFYLTPTFRLSYEIEPLEWITLRPFLGYDVFGGLTKSKFANDLVGANEFVGPSFYSLEIGFLTNYKFYRFQIGAGIKYNNHLKISHKVLDEFNLTDSRFAKESFDFGFRLSYRILDFTVSFESWFSFTNLAKINADPFNLSEYGLKNDFKKNRFTLLIGYQF
jgi:hypothetical protein